MVHRCQGWMGEQSWRSAGNVTWAGTMFDQCQVLGCQLSTEEFSRAVKGLHRLHMNRIVVEKGSGEYTGIVNSRGSMNIVDIQESGDFIDHDKSVFDQTNW